MTQLDLSNPEFDLEIKVVTHRGKRERRALLLSFFRQIRPWLKHVTHVACDHTSDGIIRSAKYRNNHVGMVKTASLSSLSGAVGYEIKMQRLKLGLTQAAVARAIGIQRTHLSDIERGIHLPRPETRAALGRVLQANFWSDESDIQTFPLSPW